MSKDPPTRMPDDDLFVRAFEALRRARTRAEELARATDTFLIEAVDGKPVRVAPPPKPGDASGSRRRGAR
jgi:hypothetical protein